MASTLKAAPATRYSTAFNLSRHNMGQNRWVPDKASHSNPNATLRCKPMTPDKVTISKTRNENEEF